MYLKVYLFLIVSSEALTDRCEYRNRDVFVTHALFGKSIMGDRLLTYLLV